MTEGQPTIGEVVNVSDGGGDCFGCSATNAHGLQLTFTRVAERTVEASFTAAAHFCGAPNVVHGGVQAALLDEAMGFANHLEGDGEFDHVTAELSVRYRRPVFAGEPLTIRGSIDKVEGRNLWATGTIVLADGTEATVGTSRWVRARAPELTKAMAAPLPIGPYPSVLDGQYQLRRWQAADAAALLAAWQRPELVATVAVPPNPSLGQAERWIAGWDARRRQRRALDLVIADESDVVIGEVGVVVDPTNVASGELGWWVDPDHWGRGIATSSVGAFTALLLADGFASLSADIAGVNESSRRLAAGVGFVLRTDGVWWLC